MLNLLSNVMPEEIKRLSRSRKGIFWTAIICCIASHYMSFRLDKSYIRFINTAMIVDVAVIRALVVPFLVTTLLAQVATEGHFKWLNFKFILSAFWNEVNVYELLVSASLLWLALNNIQAGHTFLGGIMRLKNAGLNLQTLTSAGGLLWLFIIGSSLVTTSIFEEE